MNPLISYIARKLPTAALVSTLVIFGNDAKRGWSMIGVNDQNCTILVICFS